MIHNRIGQPPRGPQSATTIEKRRAALTTHGLSRTIEYNLLSRARTRCLDPNDKSYHNYGGRGIEYRLPVDLAEATRALLAAIGPRPHKGLSLDRIDNDGHYEIGNLRWATASEQRRNQRGMASN